MVMVTEELLLRKRWTGVLFRIPYKCCVSHFRETRTLDEIEGVWMWWKKVEDTVVAGVIEDGILYMFSFMDLDDLPDQFSWVFPEVSVLLSSDSLKDRVWGYYNALHVAWAESDRYRLRSDWFRHDGHDWSLPDGWH